MTVLFWEGLSKNMHTTILKGIVGGFEDNKQLSPEGEGWIEVNICDPPYDFRDKGDNMLTTRFHLKTKEIDFNTLTKHARAHFNELVLLSHITH